MAGAGTDILRPTTSQQPPHQIKLVLSVETHGGHVTGRHIHRRSVEIRRAGLLESQAICQKCLVPVSLSTQPINDSSEGGYEKISQKQLQTGATSPVFGEHQPSTLSGACSAVQPRATCQHLSKHHEQRRIARGVTCAAPPHLLYPSGTHGLRPFFASLGTP